MVRKVNGNNLNTSIDAGGASVRSRVSGSQLRSHSRNAAPQTFKNRSKSVLPPIAFTGSQHGRNGGEANSSSRLRKGSLEPLNRSPGGLNFQGKLMKLSEQEIQSETRSVYKLDPSSDGVGSAAVDLQMQAASRLRQGPNNLDSIFKNMDVVDRAQILDKIHKMRMRVEDKKTSEPGKINGGGQQDKDKIMEQYYAMKR